MNKASISNDDTIVLIRHTYGPHELCYCEITKFLDNYIMQNFDSVIMVPPTTVIDIKGGETIVYYIYHKEHVLGFISAMPGNIISHIVLYDEVCFNEHNPILDPAYKTNIINGLKKFSNRQIDTAIYPQSSPNYSCQDKRILNNELNVVNGSERCKLLKNEYINNAFELATRLNLQFNGDISVHMLWDLSADDINDMYVKLTNELSDYNNGLYSIIDGSEDTLDVKLIKVRMAVLMEIFAVKIKESIDRDNVVWDSADLIDSYLIKDDVNK